MDIHEEISAIHERNRRVEADKAWEVSWTRRLVIAAMTYLIAIAWLGVVGNISPWLNAFIPAAGYLLSTLSLPAIKRWWVRERN